MLEAPPPIPVPQAARRTLYTASGGFFLVGAALSTASAVAFRQGLPPRDRGPGTVWTVAFTCAGVAGVIGLVLLIWRNRLAERYAVALPFLAVFLTALPMLWSRVMTPTGAVLMLWPVLYSSCLLTEPVTWATTLACVIALIGASFVDPHLGLTDYSPMAATLVLTGLVVVTLQRRVRGLVAELGRQASTDPLTGLANRRTLLDALRRQAAEHGRRGAALCLLMIDIDRFKRLNDTAGHDAGDEALRRLARLLERETREGDVTARHGGEEFTALMVDCELADAAVRADQLRGRIATDSAGWPHRITVSVGVAELAPGSKLGVSGLLTNADHALYAAKRNGRDRIALYTPGLGAPAD
ncbi:GGDEF domain-containing protein [Actinospica robiniae]|uniref:GGDEF domain-containing protein n=1 Tax=Actinospica robiniae TaxID=304901 RepID=UPI0003F7D8C2|nr:GGDEF domain-containing protein [Actinospica robiniae]